MNSKTNDFKILGTSDSIETCEHCGKSNLKRGAVLGVLDDGGAVMGELNVGLTCASRLTGRSNSSIARSAKSADSVTWSARFGAWSIRGDLRSFVARNRNGIDAPERGLPIEFTSLDQVRPGLAANLAPIIEEAREKAEKRAKNARRFSR